MNHEFLLPSSIEPLVVFLYPVTQEFFQLPLIVFRSVHPLLNQRDHRIPILGCKPAPVGEVTELLMLLHNMGVSDYDLLVHPFPLLYHVDVVRLRLGCVTDPGAVEELGDGFFV